MKMFDFNQVLKNIPELLKYLPITLELAFLAVIIGIILGLLLAIIKIKKVAVPGSAAGSGRNSAMEGNRR